MELIPKKQVMELLKVQIVEPRKNGKTVVLEMIKELITSMIEEVDNMPTTFLGDDLVCDTVTAWNKGYMAGLIEGEKKPKPPIVRHEHCPKCGKPLSNMTYEE